MINKKILAASIAAVFALNVNAAPIDMDDKDEKGLTFATESTGTLTLGMYAQTNAANALDLVVAYGFASAVADTKYVRFDLVNAKFASAPSFSVVNTGAGPLNGAVQSGGNGESYVVFEMDNVNGSTTGGAAAAIAAAGVGTLAYTTVSQSGTVASTVTYGLYEDALNAINAAPNTTYKVADAPLLSPVSINTGKFVAAQKTTALSSKAFKEFATVAVLSDADTATIGTVDGSALLSNAGGAIAPTGAAADEDNIIADVDQDVKFTGDFSVGTWTVVAGANCLIPGAAETIVLNAAKNEIAATFSPQDVTSLCQNVDKATVIDKNAYSVELVGSKVTNTIGSVVYDTTSINVPYLTTFSGYNQRIYLLNTSSTPANYTTTFSSETGVTATAGTAATGTVPGKSLLTIKATDMVTLVGATRTTAVIEVETADGNISATTQTVTKGDGSTDTTVLN
jgi:hypothetical protein